MVSQKQIEFDLDAVSPKIHERTWVRGFCQGISKKKRKRYRQNRAGKTQKRTIFMVWWLPISIADI